MTPPAQITIELLSDTTFGRGEGTAGEVDIEVEHDELGLPLVGGKSVHGLLRDAWLSMAPVFPALASAALRVLGPTGDLRETAILRVGDALVGDDTRAWIVAAVEREHHAIATQAVLHAFTDVRWQTAEQRTTGAPAETTLRTTRVLLRGLTLTASLSWLGVPTDDDLRCLALAALGTRHAGLGRNRGRGHVALALDGDERLTRRLAGVQGATR